MCGIVAVVRRPSDRRRARPRATLVARARRRPTRASLRARRRARRPAASTRSPERSSTVERELPRRAGDARAARRSGRARRARAPGRGARRARRRARRALDTDDRDSRRDRGAERGSSIAVKDALWALAPRPPAYGARGRAPRRRSSLRSRARSRRSTRSSSRCRRSTGSRCAAATPPGLHVLVTGHGLDLDDPTIARLIAARSADPLFTSGSVRVADGHLAFVYKTAAEIGELGDNTARLRAQIARRRAAAARGAAPTPPRPSCSRTRAGRASASSPKRTRTR